VDIPVELKYTEAHEWVSTRQDGVWTVGITHHAQDALGDIVSIELPEPGQKATAEAPIAVIESVKAASDIHAPVAGEITEVNTGLAGEPDSINRAPYESVVNLPSARRHGDRCDDGSEASRRILGEFGEFTPCNEPGCELFAIK
jgi:glycine cleavage system H protein